MVLVQLGAWCSNKNVQGLTLEHVGPTFSDRSERRLRYGAAI